MATLDLELVQQYVNENIKQFHDDRLKTLQSLKLQQTLKRKNPYLFRAKNVTTASELVGSILDAFLSSSEEGIFGNFLEGLAIFINHMIYGGQKSSSAGIDLDFTNDGIRYLVAIKSGPNWGNSSQYANLRTSFKNAVKVIRQSNQKLDVRTVLGICYSNSAPTDNGHYLKLCGQSFWSFISGDPNLYLRIIEPIGFEAKQHNENYIQAKNNLHNRFIRDFTNQFCDETGQIDWEKLVKFNSENM